MSGYYPGGCIGADVDRAIESEEDILDRERELYEASEAAMNEGMSGPVPFEWGPEMLDQRPPECECAYSGCRAHRRRSTWCRNRAQVVVQDVSDLSGKSRQNLCENCAGANGLYPGGGLRLMEEL